jgi:predicted metalloprotease with PDZ domain
VIFQFVVRHLVPGLLLGLGLSCRASTEVSLPPVASPQDPPEIEYTVELVTPAAPEARFNLSTPAAPDGMTTFAVDDRWGGVEDAAASILDFAVSDSHGQALAVEKASGHEWRVRSQPSERLSAAWRVAANGFRSDPDPRVHYHTLLDAELLHFIGHLALLVPRHLDGSEVRTIGFHWKGFAEAGWTVACSFGVEPGGFVAQASLDEVRHAVYLAGPNVRVILRDVRGGKLATAIAGRAWSFSDEDFVENVRSIVQAERDFFADDDLPFELVSLIPVGRADSRSRSLGGTGLTRSFALFLQPDTPLGARGGGVLDVPHLLAHELFHHWNGGVAGMEEPEQLVYWFSEGFTDFYARRLLQRAGYGGLAETARSLNDTLKDHALSPVRDLPNEGIRERFWKDRDVGRLPYLRGNLVAVLLDREIRTRSRGERSLDDFIREVVARGRAGEKVGTESLLLRIARWTDEEFAARVRSIVVEGAPLDLDPSTFEPCLELETVSLAAYDLGFDFAASRDAKEVRGVRPGSAAERAGLREGQRITSVSITYGNPETPVELGVREGDTDRMIRWLPQGDPVPVPRVSLREGAAEADCSWL